jgi:hypothetical protein
MGRNHAGRVLSIVSGAFTCHWDESGVDPGTQAISKSNREFLVVAGYLAHVEEWESLEDRWRLVLAEYGLLEKGFHMVGFCNLRWPYSTMKEERRKLLITSLLDIVRDYPRMYVAWSLKIDDYMNVIKARNLRNGDIVRAYHILGRRCIEMISDLARVASYQGKILHIFDQGNSAWPSFEALYTNEVLEALNIYRPTAQSKTDVLSLQAADVLAHQIGRHRVLKLNPKATSQRIYTDRLLMKPGANFHIGSGELLNAYYEEKALEKARATGRPLKRGLKAPMSAYHAELARQMFRSDGGYPFDGRLRELQ